MASSVQQQSCSIAWLLSPWFDITVKKLMSGITLDTRILVKGDLFVALKGAVTDGRAYIDTAIKLEASAVLAETTDQAQHGQIEEKQGTPIIYFFELSKQLNAIAIRYYFVDTNCDESQDNNLSLHEITAVTGTNGKTTIATLLANSYMWLGQQSAQMGTIGNGLYGKLEASLNTTLDAVAVCRELKKYQLQGVKQTVMEVSSHGLLQARIASIPFKTAIFTNLTRDHLDYHGTMEAYADAKKKLFSEFPLKHKIINTDDPIGREWLKEYPSAVAYGCSASPDSLERLYFQVTKVKYLAQGLYFEFVSSWGEGEITGPFYGDFNVSNIAAVSCALLVDGFSIEQVQSVIKALTVVPGRMEQYHFAAQNVTFIVDYAHTPDALKSALKALQCHKQQGRIISVFGCGGDRDKGKRPEMAKVAEQGSNKVVIVDDNPRSENAQSIVDDIKLGLTLPDSATVIHDRKQAILHLLKTAQANDIILLAGKGHEDYQIFGDKKVHYSDRECLTNLLSTTALK